MRDKMISFDKAVAELRKRGGEYAHPGDRYSTNMSNQIGLAVGDITDMPHDSNTIVYVNKLLDQVRKGSLDGLRTVYEEINNYIEEACKGSVV